MSSMSDEQKVVLSFLGKLAGGDSVVVMEAVQRYGLQEDRAMVDCVKHVIDATPAPQDFMLDGQDLRPGIADFLEQELCGGSENEDE